MQNKMLILWLFTEVSHKVNLLDEDPKNAVLAEEIDTVLQELALLLDGLSFEDLIEINQRVNALKLHFSYFRAKVWPDKR